MTATRCLYFPPGTYLCSFGLRVIKDDGETAVIESVDLPPWINVKDFGAVGDGVADDTDAINAAIDELNR